MRRLPSPLEAAMFVVAVVAVFGCKPSPCDDPWTTDCNCPNIDCNTVTPPALVAERSMPLAPPTIDELLQVLRRHRDKTLPLVPVSLRADVEAFAAQYPVDSPPGVSPIEPVGDFNATGAAAFEVRRRDWAYALRGGVHTLAAAAAGPWLDAGFWCYLEAALLQPREPEHLSNVGFHLNIRGEHADAAKVLAAARAIDGRHAAALNNLGFAHGALGEHERAIEASWAANIADGGNPLRLERLAAYHENVGELELARAMRTLSDEVVAPHEPGSISYGQALVALNAQYLDSVTTAWVTAQSDYHVRVAVAEQDLNEALAQLAQQESECLPGPSIEGLPCEAVLEIFTDIFCTCIPQAQVERLAVVADFQVQRLGLTNALAAQEWRICNEYDALGADFIRSWPGLTAEERVRLREHWRYTIVGIPLEAEQLRRELAASAREQLGIEHARLSELLAACESATSGSCPGSDAESITLNLVIASVSLSTDGTITIGVGQGLRLEVQYNVRTGLTGLTVGGGVNLGPLLESGVYLTMRDGEAEFGATLGVRTNSPIVPGTTTLANPKLMLWQNQQAVDAGSWPGPRVGDIRFEP